MREIQKDVPVILRQAILADNSSQTFSTWGGYVRGDLPPERVFKFEADGNGGGSWSNATEPQLMRSHGGAFVSTPGSGFYFGGLEEDTDTIKKGDYVPGFLQVNYTFQEAVWTQRPNAPYSQLGSINGGSAHHVPAFRLNGLVVILGGIELGNWEHEDRSMDTIWFMDPAAPDQWHSQKTPAPFPRPRRWQCVVGAQRRNNTYEIFIFGGNNDVVLDEVWVLSLPGFFWTKYDGKIPCSFMSGVVAGQCQMIVVGGLKSKGNAAGSSLPQGLGIFNLTTLEWKGDFDPGAAAYDSPDSVKSWYNDGQVPACCSQPPTSTPYEQKTRNLAHVKYHPGVEEFLNLPHSPADNSLSPGEMGGAVGGGVLGAVLIGVAVFLLLRRRKKKQVRRSGTETGYSALKPSGSSWPPTSTTPKRFELPEGHGTSEVGGRLPSYATVEWQAY
ncbi:kelch repeat protein [Colletotrichum graminicola M1.001]|uniref:Kelch repeat protein n=1 Tax=Colletotrichum graminicola (strain M1.001 / M2 / FGSC 10212) TaxID=645133 RepID=E3Q3R1_COLGM|nr:kelch repeat protein [Colletotrichum graminicola M1.001]EFQ25663.1 kelch repeat protein [Colletotrichum graminicola M1.001]